MFEITPAAAALLDELSGGPLPEYVPTGIVWFSDDFAVIVDPPFPYFDSEADRRREADALGNLFLRIFDGPDPESYNWSRWRRRGWSLAPELAFAVAIDPLAAPGDPIPALARVLRRLAGTAVNR
jgi:hypothetical protein